MCDLPAFFTLGGIDTCSLPDIGLIPFVSDGYELYRKNCSSLQPSTPPARSAATFSGVSPSTSINT